MKQPFTFEPNVIAKLLEEWQKIWTQGVPAQSATAADAMGLWQQQMQGVAQFWQNAWSNILPTQDGAQASDSPDWSNLPFFTQVQEMYRASCEFIETQLNANIANLPADKQESLRYMTNQYLVAMNPNNFLLTNPDALQEAYETKGQSLVKGIQNYWSDVEKGRISMSDDSEFTVGENVAVTPGKVVLRNELIELLQYTPTTEKVYEKPLLIVPPCVNKYYLMDMGPQKSMTEYYVSQGYRVYLVSWKSATEEMKHFTWDTYVERGVISAINAVRSITKQDSINALGFCIGGVLLATTLAVLKARGEPVVDNVIFMASMADHSDPGDIKHFITDEFMRSREAKMAKGGIISGLELQAAFSFLRPQDLVWNYVQDNYLKGKTPKPFDLLFWNNDSVDLPLPMHTFFLREFYINNALTKPNSMSVCGVPMDMGVIDIPAYFFASEGDHIVLASSVYKGVKLFSGCPEKRFVLGESGHIAGAINPVSKNRRSYWTGEDLSLDYAAWREKSDNHPGSWWMDLNEWLKTRSGKEIKAVKTFGNTTYKPLCDAPGEFVRARAMPALMTHFA
ncbi:MAG: alpha/beta fold hydrolase [Neisseria sp.]|nr:alpha/beta fold hydrolase [Neisseria sp.]